MEPLAGRPFKQEDFLLRTMNIFAHPSTILWRAIEAKEIYTEFSRRGPLRPVLDLGCGDGRFSKVTFGAREVDVGVDVALAALSEARRTACYSNLIGGDGSRLPFRDETFEAVLSNSVLEHIPNVIDVLREIRRVLRDDGLLVFTVPSANFARFLLPSAFRKLRFLGPIIEWYAVRRNALLQHYNVYQANVWSSWLATEGFSSIQIRYCLSKDAVQVWDAMALGTYLARAILRISPGFMNHILYRSRKLRLAFLRAILRKFYETPAAEGGDLMIVALKGQTERNLEPPKQVPLTSRFYTAVISNPIK